jgi:hypothetical protein
LIKWLREKDRDIVPSDFPQNAEDTRPLPIKPRTDEIKYSTVPYVCCNNGSSQIGVVVCSEKKRIALKELIADRNACYLLQRKRTRGTPQIAKC